MPKAGKEYQQIVAAVAQALDPGALVEEGLWVEGPDGRRDMDVSVRGTKDGVSRLILIECKDWKVPVGIEVVDALDSKRRDFGADEAMIYSNSGFTENALRKAVRIGIEALSALKAADHRIHVTVYEEVVARAVRVKSYQAVLFEREPGDTSRSWNLADLTFRGLPVQNWLHGVSADILKEFEHESSVVAVFAFQPTEGFELQGLPIDVHLLKFILDIDRKCVSQVVRKDVTIGAYDHQSKSVLIPSGAFYSIGTFDLLKWRDTDVSPDEWDRNAAREPTGSRLSGGSFSMNFTLYRAVPLQNDAGVPSLDEFVAERLIRPNKTP